VLTFVALKMGGIAQLVERLVRNEKARGSNPLTSTSPAENGEKILSESKTALVRALVGNAEVGWKHRAGAHGATRTIFGFGGRANIG
jgi:hypothetical protein